MTNNLTPEQENISPLRHIKIELHAIQNFPPSCLNRDDTGMPKECQFGGVRRARVSSQCLKRWMREHFEEAGQEIGMRTKELGTELYAMIKDDLPAEKREQLRDVIEVFLSLYYSAMETRKTGKTKVPLFVGRAEMREAVKCINELWDALVTEAIARKADEAAKDADKKYKGRPANQILSADGKITTRLGQAQHTLDIALFGRMMAAKPEQNVDGSCQVAHAISTHRVHPELDYYTAVDDVKQRRLKQSQDFFAAADDLSASIAEDEGGEDNISGTSEGDDATDDGASGGSTGAAMLGLIGYNSACYYRYLLLDCDELAKNRNFKKNEVVVAPTEAELEADIRSFFDAAIEALPQAKRTSMAQQTLPNLFMLVVRLGGAPCSLANAFADPVRLDDNFDDLASDQDLVGKSVARLAECYQILTRVYGSDGIMGVIVEPTLYADRLGDLKNSILKRDSSDARSSKDIALEKMIDLVREARKIRDGKAGGGAA